MDNSEGLKNILEDTQASLATALARIEAYRIKEKHLVKENLKLLSQLNQQTENVASNEPNLTLPENDKAEINDSDNMERKASRTMSDANVAFSLQEEHPVLLYTKEGKISATLVASPDCIEFFESKARFSSSDYVGMSFINEFPNKKDKSFSKSSLVSYIFGKTKQSSELKDSNLSTNPSMSPVLTPLSKTEQMIIERKSTPFTTNLVARPELRRRRSWDGSFNAKPSSSSNTNIETNDNLNEIEKTGIWQILWKDGGGKGKLRKLTFEASLSTKNFIDKYIETWSSAQSKATKSYSPNSEPGDTSNNDVMLAPSGEEIHDIDEMSDETISLSDEGALVPPKHFIPNGLIPKMFTKSILLTQDHIKSLTAVVPVRYRQSSWHLLYSTEKHGFSLQSLYRRATNLSPTILIIKDASDYIFGCFCSDAWKMAPRFYGTGETFIFQLEPHRIYYQWKHESKVRNDFFMFGSPESLGVGGTGHFAIWIDSDLLYGHSGMCDTFGSPCIAAKEEFKILKLELWHLE